VEITNQIDYVCSETGLVGLLMIRLINPAINGASKMFNERPEKTIVDGTFDEIAIHPDFCV
jgi:hypothetical protein